MKVATKGKITDYGTVILAVVSGSTSYGTNITETDAQLLASKHGGSVEDYISDKDIRGVFIPYPQYMYCREPLEVFEDPSEEDATYFSLKKFVQLLFDATPNALEVLFTDEQHIVFANDIGRKLLSMRRHFLSKTCFSTFGSYAASQLKKMVVKSGEFNRNNKRLALINTTRDKGTPYDSKNAMHLIRLLQMAIEIFNTNTVSTLRPNRDFLLNIRHGNFTLDEIQKIAQKLFEELEFSYKNSTLQSYPNFDLINTWLVDTTLRHYGFKEDNTLKNANKNLTLLPSKYTMIENKTSFLIGDAFSPHVSSSDAFGFFFPYHDWFIGLYNDEDVKFENTSLDSVYKFAYGLLSYNPKHLFSVFAPRSFTIMKDSFSHNVIELLLKHHSMHYINASLNGFVLGNLNKMRKWEKTKIEHTQLANEKRQALTINKSHWKEQFELLDKKQFNTNEQRSKERLVLVEQYNRWSDLTSNRRSMPLYPPVPKNTSNISASLMGRFGYDTFTAAMLHQQLSILGHILEPNKPFFIEKVLEECHAIQNGKFSTFELFEKELLVLHDYVSSLKNEDIPQKVNLDFVYEEITKLIIKHI